MTLSQLHSASVDDAGDQVLLFNKCLLRGLALDWLAFLDFDEFVVLDPTTRFEATLGQYLGALDAAVGAVEIEMYQCFPRPPGRSKTLVRPASTVSVRVHSVGRLARGARLHCATFAHSPAVLAAYYGTARRLAAARAPTLHDAHSARDKALPEHRPRPIPAARPNHAPALETQFRTCARRTALRADAARSANKSGLGVAQVGTATAPRIATPVHFLAFFDFRFFLGASSCSRSLRPDDVLTPVDDAGRSPPRSAASATPSPVCSGERACLSATCSKKKKKKKFTLRQPLHQLVLALHPTSLASRPSALAMRSRPRFSCRGASFRTSCAPFGRWP